MTSYTPEVAERLKRYLGQPFIVWTADEKRERAEDLRAALAELDSRAGEIERLRDRVFELAAELGYAPDGISAGILPKAPLAILEAKPSEFTPPATPTLRERRLAAETAGWRALGDQTP